MFSNIPRVGFVSVNRDYFSKSGLFLLVSWVCFCKSGLFNHNCPQCNFSLLVYSVHIISTSGLS